jgi:hypothetical protein
MAKQSRVAKQGEDGMQRRTFLKGGAATFGLGAIGVAEPGWSAPTGEPKIQHYGTLGKTGLKISDISFGSSQSTDPALVTHAFDRGINFFDSAESYEDGLSEEAIGKALAGHRDEVFLTSKVKCLPHTAAEDLMSALEGSLRRLKTDHIDIYFNHAVNDVERLKNEQWYKFADRAKTQGKIRFTGMSGHAGRLIPCLDYAIDHDLVDVILCAYNFGQDPAFYQRFISRLDFVAVQFGLPPVLAKAHAKGIGVIAMKVLRGARLNDMRPFEFKHSTFAQAAFRWTLSSPDVDALIVSMTEKTQIDEFIAASGAPAPTGADLGLLEEYLITNNGGYCNHGCESCHGACPSGVAVNEVLRTRMYAVDYGNLEYARSEYGNLDTNASACLSCSGTPCLGQCPSGLQVSDLTQSAHRLLA